MRVFKIKNVLNELENANLRPVTNNHGIMCCFYVFIRRWKYFRTKTIFKEEFNVLNGNIPLEYRLKSIKSRSSNNKHF